MKAAARLAASTVGAAVALLSLAAEPGPPVDPDAWGPAALTAHQRYRRCAFAAAANLAARPTASAPLDTARIAAAAEAGCAGQRTELRTMLLFEYRLHRDAARRADLGVAAARSRLLDALAAQLHHAR